MLERLSFLTMADRSYRISIVKKKGLLLERFLSSLIIFSTYLLYLSPQIISSTYLLHLSPPETPEAWAYPPQLSPPRPSQKSAGNLPQPQAHHQRAPQTTHQKDLLSRISTH